MGTRYSYSASKTNGKFFGAVYATTGDDPSVQIGTIDGIRTERGVKSFVDGVARLYHRENRAPDQHSTSHYINGAVHL